MALGCHWETKLISCINNYYLKLAKKSLTVYSFKIRKFVLVTCSFLFFLLLFSLNFRWYLEIVGFFGRLIKIFKLSVKQEQRKTKDFERGLINNLASIQNNQVFDFAVYDIRERMTISHKKCEKAILVFAQARPNLN